MSNPPLCLYCYTRKASTRKREGFEWQCCEDCAARYSKTVLPTPAGELRHDFADLLGDIENIS